MRLFKTLSTLRRDLVFDWPSVADVNGDGTLDIVR